MARECDMADDTKLISDIKNEEIISDIQDDLISVIIPVYNVQEYIGECLKSIVNQTYKNLEILVIDDCGQDNSIEIAEFYAQNDGRIKIIKHAYNHGVGPARNTGISKANGKYLIFVDSDDYFLDMDVLENLHKKIVETDVDLVALKFPNHIDELSEKVYDSNKKITVTLKNFNKVLDNFPIVVWGKLYKTEFLKKNNIKFIDKNVIHEDDGFTIKVLAALPTYTCISKEGYFYRQNPSSIMHTRTKEKTAIGKLANVEDSINYILGYCDSPGELSKKIKLSYRYSKFFSIWGKMFRFCWHKYDKHIVIMFINIFSQKFNNNILKTKLFGIELFHNIIEG